MKCIICHNDNIEKSTVQEEFIHNNDIITIQIDIPICKNCGERYYDRKTVRYLEDIRNKIKNNELKYKEIGKVLSISK
jgi:YgiT-type zinc finger domain-containing protein